LSPNDELVFAAVRKGYDTIKKISSKLHVDRSDIGVYVRRLVDSKHVKKSVCITCKQTITFVPV